MAALQHPAPVLRRTAPSPQPQSGWHAPATAQNIVQKLNIDIEQRDRDGATALIRAADKGDLKQIRQLLADGADINAADKNGWNALMKAAKGHHLKAAADLITAGANLHAETRNGWNVLSIAVKSGSPQIIALIASAAGTK